MTERITKFITLNDYTHGVVVLGRRLPKGDIVWTPTSRTFCGILLSKEAVLSDEPPDAYLCQNCCRRFVTRPHFVDKPPSFLRKLPSLPIVASTRH